LVSSPEHYLVKSSLQVVKFLISLCPLRPKYLSQHPILERTQHIDFFIHTNIRT
jgi:hypothetical protein